MFTRPNHALTLTLVASLAPCLATADQTQAAQDIETLVANLWPERDAEQEGVGFVLYPPLTTSGSIQFEIDDCTLRVIEEPAPNSTFEFTANLSLLTHQPWPNEKLYAWGPNPNDPPRGDAALTMAYTTNDVFAVTIQSPTFFQPDSPPNTETRTTATYTLRFDDVASEDAITNLIAALIRYQDEFCRVAS